MMTTGTILVVDDDPLICKGLKFNLELAGYHVTTATNARVALEQARSSHLDAAILDVVLPGEDGLSLCRQLKAEQNLPVIFLSARRRELDEIIGLEVGGDDYITKPFNIDVLLAHLKAVLRRGEPGIATQSTHPPILRVGPFVLDTTAHTVTRDDEPIALAPREFELLHFFMAHPAQVFATNKIIEHVWGAEFLGEPQVVYVQIRGLREKIEPDPSHARYLLTLRGVGYKFVS